MIKVIHLSGKSVPYSLERKKVKNINLRIREDGSILVSANRRVSEKVIEDFLQPNHSAMFYGELEKVMPDWKERGKKLKNIHV